LEVLTSVADNETRLEFYLGMPGHVEDLHFELISPDSASDGEEPEGFVLRWKTRGGLDTGTELDLIDFDSETKATLSFMMSLGGDASMQEFKTVKLLVTYASDLEVALKEITGGTIHRLPWEHYSDIAINESGQRAHVHEQSGGLIRYPAKNSFASIAEARLMLSVGIMLEYRQAPLKLPRHQWPGAEKSEIYLWQQFRALNRLFNATKVNRDLWWPLVLNQRADLLPVRLPTSALGLDAENVKSKMLQVHQSLNWSEEQLAALSENQLFKGTVQILEGPPGSGKSQVLAGKALFFALVGFSVLVCAPTAPVAKAFAACLKKLCISASVQDQVQQLEVIELFPLELIYEDMKATEQARDLSKTNILVTTPNFVSSKACCADFGANARGIIVIHEDSCLIPDTELFATVFSLEHHEKVQGVILSTDIREWPMDLATLTDPIRQIKREGEKMRSLYSLFFLHFYDKSEEKHYNPKGIKTSGKLSSRYGLNEFADQLGLALVTRLLRQNFPSTRLEDQHRLHPSLVAFPSRRAYGCQSICRERVSEESSSVARFHAVIKDWLGPNAPNAPSLLFVNADNPEIYIPSVCVKARGQSESKSNTRNVEVVMELLQKNYKNNGAPAEDIKVVTPYADQLRCYGREYEAEMQKLGLDSHPFPEVRTVDSMRGHQACIIIYDLVVTCGDSSHGIGICAEEFRANIASTRATDIFIIVGSSKLLTIFPRFWAELMMFKQAREPMPYIVSYIQALDEEGLACTAPTLGKGMRGYIPPRQCWKPKSENFEGAWERDAHSTAHYDPGRGQ
jgi:AAA domain